MTSSNQRTADSLVLIAARVPRRLLRLEPQLALSKAFEHRYLSALESTELFTEEYLKSARLSHSRLVSSDPAVLEKYRPVRTPWSENLTRTATRLWTARQHADQLGIPYSFYISNAMTALLEEDRYYKRVPAPNQIYSADALKGISRKWAEWTDQSGWSPRLPDNYRSENFRNEPPQTELVKHLFERIDRRPEDARIFALGQYIAVRRWVPEGYARARYGDEIVNRALRDHTLTDHVSERKAKPYVPACVGLVGAFQSESKICSTCPVAPKCERIVTKVTARVRAIHGCDDPVSSRKRINDRDRQRKSRASRKLAKGADTAITHAPEA